MNCEDVRARDLAEEYLLGRLSPADQEEYERHFFECDACFSDLEALRATASALQPAAGRARRPAATARWLPLAAVLVLAAASTVFVLLSRSGRESAPATAAVPADRTTPAQQDSAPPRSSDSLTRLARFDPPPYLPPRLRSTTPAGDFEKGMARYSQRDCAGAIPLLQSAVERAADADSARFYLGVCLLQTGRADDGVRVLDALGSDPQNALAEEARFFSAYGHLQRGDAERASAALERTIALKGDRETQARALRDEIEKLRQSR